MSEDSANGAERAPARVKFDHRNYRKHDDRNKKLIRKSLEELGAGRSVVIDAEDELIAGNGVYEQAEALGLKTRVIETDGSELVVVKRTDLHTDDEKRRKLALADNATSDSSSWDVDALKADWEPEELDEWGVEGVWEDEPEPVSGETEPDAVPDVAEDEPTVSVRGKVYQLGEHRLMCGDSTSADDVAKLMQGEKADMVFTDPPYNVAIGDKNKYLNEANGSRSIEKNIAGDAGMTDEECGRTLWLPAFTRLLENAKDCCAIYVTMPQGGTHMMMMMMHEAGWQVKHELIWVKSSPTFSMGRLDYDYQHEPIVYGWNKTHKSPRKGKFNKSIWEIAKPQKCNLHPTMKPIELIENALLNSSDISDVIIDLFGGSGSTLIACEQTKRKARLMELDEHYCDVIRKRWAEFVHGEGCNWEMLTPEAE